jgi:xanthine dehydrogenase accessory factor
VSSAREIRAILAALRSGPAALATLVKIQGSSYRRPGARCLIRSDGRVFGSISGGCLEEDIRLRAQQVLQTGQPQVAIYDTADENDLLWGTGMGCQGKVWVLIERLPEQLPPWVAALRENFFARRSTALSVVYDAATKRSLGTYLRDELLHADPAGIFAEEISTPPHVIIFGAGDDAIPLVAILQQLGWYIVVCDSRESYLTAERFSLVDERHHALLEFCANSKLLDATAHVVIMTHRYSEDLAVLRALNSRPGAYLGILGPKRRTDRLLTELANSDSALSPQWRKHLFAPVGLDLGGGAAESVALSIAAELHARHANRTPLHLREKTQPIHE